MPDQIVRSAGHALRGLVSAWRSERNIRLFLCGFIAVIVVLLWLSVSLLDLVVVIVSALVFLAVELINTAIERVVDALDEHLKKDHQAENFVALKSAKDIAASASLVCLLAFGVIVGVVVWGYV